MLATFVCHLLEAGTKQQGLARLITTNSPKHKLL